MTYWITQMTKNKTYKKFTILKINFIIYYQLCLTFNFNLIIYIKTWLFTYLYMVSFMNIIIVKQYTLQGNSIIYFEKHLFWT